MTGSLQKRVDSISAARPKGWMSRFLLCCVAAIDVEVDAGLEFVLDEEDDTMCNLFRTSEASQRME